MQMPYRHFIILLTLGAGAVFATTTSADAGQPWSCQCKGASKRFIASTHACEWSQPKNTSVRLARQLTPCTRAEFVAWNRKACRSEGCTLPRSMMR